MLYSKPFLDAPNFSNRLLKLTSQTDFSNCLLKLPSQSDSSTTFSDFTLAHKALNGPDSE